MESALHLASKPSRQVAPRVLELCQHLTPSGTIRHAGAEEEGQVLPSTEPVHQTAPEPRDWASLVGAPSPLKGLPLTPGSGMGPALLPAPVIISGSLSAEGAQVSSCSDDEPRAVGPSKGSSRGQARR